MPTIKNLDTIILGPDFETPFPFRDDEKSEIVSKDVRWALKLAMLLDDESHRATEGDKFDNWFLAKRIHEANGELSITDKERETMRAMVRKKWVTLIAGQVLNVIDPPATE